MDGKYDSRLIGPSQASVFRTRDKIREDVEELIWLNDEIYPKDIQVIVDNGIVTLTGRVRDQVASDEAEMAVREVMGVTAVFNELEISE